MIAYCGLRHFYIHHFEPPRPRADTYYILTHNGEIWDFSPQLKDCGFVHRAKPQTVFQLEKPVLTVPIDLADFQVFAGAWHDFGRQYTNEVEPEYPHSWYLRFQQKSILEQYIIDFNQKVEEKVPGGAIWGVGASKLIAKLAAHNLPPGENIIAAEETGSFLNRIPLSRLPLPESADLEKLGLKTIGELARTPLIELAHQFGKRAPVLQKLGRGQDLQPFQPQKEAKLQWALDCTTLEGYLRPLAHDELWPYIERGLRQLASDLHCRGKIAALLNLKAWAAGEKMSETQRRLKEATADWRALARAVQGLIPREPIAQIVVSAEELKPAPAVQLNVFREEAAPIPILPFLPIQKGVQLPRREQFLLLWKEYFKNE